MRIEMYCYETDNGTPIEIANALIETIVGFGNDEEIIEQSKKELAEIAEHIQVYLKYNRNEGVLE